MTPSQVRLRLSTINKHQVKWDSAEKELQNLCTHPNTSKKYACSSGNYDPTADSYWIEFRCPDCNKFWTVDQ
jgi:hypothetical protein